MYKLIGLTLALFAGWTLATHAVVLGGGTLDGLMLYGPLGALLFGGMFMVLPACPRSAMGTEIVATQRRSLPDNPWMFIGMALLAAASLAASWICFWVLSVATLLAYLFSRVECHPVSAPSPNSPAAHWRQLTTVLLAVLAAAVLTLWISRSDADDAFYIGVAAFANGHPGLPLMAQDPMFGEPHWPIIFPSYRFTSYELLIAALARASGVHAADIAYRVLPPLAAGFVVLSTFFLARQLAPRRWLAIGVGTLLLGLILGECHRGAANFVFVRMFQGKAVYLSALLPLVYALMHRYACGEQSARDVLVLACAQMAAIGLSNFAMLAAPMAAGTALCAVLLTTPRAGWRRLLPAMLTLIVPLPYLVYVAIASKDGALVSGTPETAEMVWHSVFGEKQQYLVALLVLTGPAFARDTRDRIWLAVPPLVLLAIFLNPFFAGLISRYLTTAPVYWRVTWCLPILAYLAWSFCLVFDRAVERFAIRNAAAWMAPLLVLLVLLTGLPFNVLRPSNEVQWDFGQLKIPASELAVARAANALAPPGMSLAAPESVSFIVPMFEHHPRLVGVRNMYLQTLAVAMDSRDYQARMMIADFVTNGLSPGADLKAMSGALVRLKVGVMVLSVDAASRPRSRSLLAGNGFVLVETLEKWTIWQRRTPYLAVLSSGRESGVR